MSNLARLSEKKAAHKYAPFAADSREAVRRANGASHAVTKQKCLLKGVAQSKLILVKKPKTGLPRHPNLFAARNMYYDERWIEKQERGFVQWLNFVLTPPDEYLAVTNKTRVDAGSLSLETGHVLPRLAPTKEILSFRAYAARRRLNRLRRAACELYQSESFVNIICKIEVEVESRRIAARKDKMIHADLGIKQRLLDLLLHYSSLWLRIGLETIFGEILMLQSNLDMVGISKFILTRILASPDIAAEFAHPTVPHLYKEGYVAAMSRHTVKKFLILVYFLDQAKSSRLIDHDPCLFCKDAAIKSSKEILIEFSREVLSGEGDITRHLSYLGYTVCQTQKPIDEFDFAVTNLSSDLRDGLRLSRVLELLAGNYNVLPKLRIPAISRLQKIHNTEVFFKAMHERGLDYSSLPGAAVTARDIVDGHREKTLSLLWQLIIHFQSSIQVNEEQLKDEINILLKSLQLKVAMQKIGAISTEDCQARRDSGETKLMMDNQRLKLIFQWCRLVCLHYGVKVENFTVSFSDGRALCCLLHHYHPALLPLSEIRFQTTVSLQENAEDKCQYETDSNLSFDLEQGGGLLSDENNPEMFSQLLANEKSNFKTLFEKVSALGGVPLMLKSADMSNTIPDEKVVSTYVSYLCARLLDIREEVKAARYIQMAWRRRQLQRAIQERQRRTRAAITIQHWIRDCLARQALARESKAATCIQTAWKDPAAQLCVNEQEVNIQNAGCRSREEQSVLSKENLWQSFSEQDNQTVMKGQEEVNGRDEVSQGLWQSCSGQDDQAAVEENINSEKQAGVTQQSLWQSCSEQDSQAQMKENVNSEEQAALTQQSLWQFCSEQDSQAQMKENVNSEEQAALIQQSLWQSCSEQDSQAQMKENVNSEEQAALTQQSLWQSCSEQDSQAQMKENVNSEEQAALTQQSLWQSCSEQDNQAAVEENVNSEEQAALTRQSLWQSCSGQDDQAAVEENVNSEEQAALTQQSLWQSCSAQDDQAAVEENVNSEEQAALTQQSLWQSCSEQDSQAQMKENVNSEEQAALTQQSLWQSCSEQDSQAQMKENVNSEEQAALTQQSLWQSCSAQDDQAAVEENVNSEEQAALTQQSLWQSCSEQDSQAQMKENVNSEEQAALTQQSLWQSCSEQDNLAQMKENVNSEEQAALTQQNLWQSCSGQDILAQMKENVNSEEQAALTQQNLWQSCSGQDILAQMKENVNSEEQAALTQQSLWQSPCTQYQLTQMEHQEEINGENEVAQSLWQSCSELENQTKMKEEEISREEQTVLTQYCQSCPTENQQTHVKEEEGVNGEEQENLTQDHQSSPTKYQKVHMKEAEQKEDARRKEEAVIMIQKLVRGSQCRKDLERKQASAIKIQSFWRVHLAKNVLKKLRQDQAEHSATVIQKWVKRNFCFNQYIKKRRAAIVLQKQWRMRQAIHIRQTLLAERYTIAVIIIQRYVRTWLAQKAFQETQAALALQSYWRMRQARRELAMLKLHRDNKAATVLQRFIKSVMYSQKYLKMKKAAIILQRNWRKTLSQRKLKALKAERDNNAATVIQRYFKGRGVQNDFRNMQKLAIIIQGRWRMLQASRKFKDMKLKREYSALVIQRSYRAFRCRCDFDKCRAAVIMIQRTWRMHFATKMLRRLRLEHEILAAITIQKMYRGMLERRKYNSFRSAVIVVQKKWRITLAMKCAARQRHQQQENAAVVLQRNWRRWRCRSYFVQLKSAAAVLQSAWKMVKARRLLLSLRLLRRERSAVIIQKIWRRHLACQKFTAKRRAALRIQSVWRMFQVKRRYWYMREAALLIQVWHKANVEAKRQQMMYQKLKRSAIYIQSWWRCQVLRKRFEAMRLSAVVIQTSFRCFHQRVKFLEVKSAATLIQCHYRHYLKGKEARKEYLTLKHAAITIQMVFRRNLLQRHEKREAAALVLQTAFRKMNARKKYVEQKVAAQTIQRHFRTLKEARMLRQRFLRHKHAAGIIQNAYRTHIMRRQYTNIRYSVIKIQAIVRSRLVRRWFENLRNAAIVIQRRFRALKLKRVQYAAFQQLKKSAVIIQRFHRAVQLRKAVQQEISHWHSAATKIQAYYRRWRQRRCYLLLHSAALCFQRRYRSHLLGQAVREEFRLMKEAALIIQRRWRSYRLVQVAKRRAQERRAEIEYEMKVKLEEESLKKKRKEEELEIERKVKEMREKRAAIVLQRYMKMVLDSKHREQAVLIIQKHIRGYQTRVRYHNELKKIYRIQRLIKGFACRRRFERIKLAVRIIQNRWKEIKEGRRCRAEFVSKLEATVKIQAQFRMSRQRAMYQENLRRIISVQTCIRALLQKRRCERMKELVIWLQRKVRINQQVKRDRKRFLKICQSVIKIQTVVRVYLANKRMQREKSTLKIYPHPSMHKKRTVLCQTNEALQAQKSLIEMKWQQLDKQAKESAVLAFHCAFKKYYICQTETKHLAACIIQRAVRQFLFQRTQKKNSAALVIQTALKGYVHRRKMIKNQSAVMIQSAVRGFLCRSSHLAKRRSVVLLQAAVRGWQARRSAQDVRRQQKTVICLQAYCRGFLVRKRILPVLREKLNAVQEQKRKHKASIRIQALWRGFVARRNIKDRRVTLARKRLEEANRFATKDKTLGSRTSSALGYLLKEKDLAYILEALMHLEVSTRLSPVCCEKMVEVNAISVLYRLINSCNRSIPHMELIRYSVNILLNLAKYEKTINAVIEPQESISTVLDLLQIYREKGTIFNNCCMLLGILGLHPDRKSHILRNPLIVDRLQSIHALALRKQRTNQKRQITQAKMAAMKSFSCTLPVLTPSKSRRRRIRPEWVLAGDNIKSFDDSVAAVTFVMDVLQIGPKM